MPNAFMLTPFEWVLVCSGTLVLLMVIGFFAQRELNSIRGDYKDMKERQERAELARSESETRFYEALDKTTRVIEQAMSALREAVARFEALSLERFDRQSTDIADLKLRVKEEHTAMKQEIRDHAEGCPVRLSLQ